MNPSESKQLEHWLADKRFRQWCLNPGSDDYIYWENWLNDHPEYRSLAKDAAQIVLGLEIREKEVDQGLSQTSLNQVLEVINHRVPKQREPVVKSLRSQWIRAAAITLLLGLCTTWYFYSQRSLKIVVSTNFGERLELVLPDQTEVVLSANSSITYLRENPRNVTVSGEAFFNVKKKPETGEKFFVNTGDLVIEVLGTAFNVNTVFEETKVFLQEGKVKLNLNIDADEPILMQPGDLFEYSDGKEPTLKQMKAKADEQTDWTDGSIEFQNESVHLIIERLKPIYGFVEVDFTSEVLSRQYRVAVPLADESLALDILSRTIGHKVVKDGDRWIIE